MKHDNTENMPFELGFMYQNKVCRNKELTLRRPKYGVWNCVTLVPKETDAVGCLLIWKMQNHGTMDKWQFT